MTDQVYCYHCRRWHPPEEMRTVVVGGRTRWRCRRSLEAVRANRAQRDAFGLEVAALNRGAPQRPLPHCVREVMLSSSSGRRWA